MRPTNVAMSGMPVGKSWMGWWGNFAGPKQKGIVTYGISPLQATRTRWCPSRLPLQRIRSSCCTTSLLCYSFWWSLCRIRLGQQEGRIPEQQSGTWTRRSLISHFPDWPGARIPRDKISQLKQRLNSTRTPHVTINITPPTYLPCRSKLYNA
ncbi:hypothetical protein OPQ81_003461 [Rhizoctonia solani]|nr:hypothetical protein OPQ81_003461 [Rhizoctonia solani]